MGMPEPVKKPGRSATQLPRPVVVVGVEADAVA